jgi:hypothetical protein
VWCRPRCRRGAVQASTAAELRTIGSQEASRISTATVSLSPIRLNRSTMTRGAMNFTLGLFDLFAYAIQGSIYLAIFVYSAQTLDWIDLAQVSNISSIFIIVAIAIASFLLGHITYPLAGIIEQVFRLRELRALDAKIDFVEKYRGSSSHRFLHADLSVLLAAAELHDREVATEISRLRAVGLMLRNCSLALVFATITALTMLTIGGGRLPATLCVVVLALAAVRSYWQGQTLRHWANLKTFEICSLIPGIDDKIQPPNDETST